jgi:hypothetical protein
MRSRLAVLLGVVVAGCATMATYHGQQLDALYGSADPARYDRPPQVAGAPDFQSEVKPVLDGRCVVCHGCYDAPCQLNLASYEGVTRGSSKERVYATRFDPSEPTRMFFDAQGNAGPAGWRARGFEAVLNERAATAEANREGSVLYRSLRLKQAHPLPAGEPAPKSLDFSLDRAQQCPAAGEMDAFEKKFADWGMPFGLPGLSAQEHALLARWIEAGAPYRAPAPLPAAYGPRIAQWENFLNGDSPKERLAARYIYEHWFVGQLYFDDLPGEEFFDLVRSKTPPGRPIEVVATRRPYDDPGEERVYYRLRRMTDTPLAKTRMPYALNPARLERMRGWFHNAPYEVKALPSYAPGVASNPFAAFEQLPVTSRYRFMLEDAQFIMQGFIKGPVCRGQVALNVINDHFWVLFANPDHVDAESDGAFLAKERDNLRLPAERESDAGLLSWTRYAGREADYLAAKSRYLKARLAAAPPPTLKLLWDGGERRNPNAALTVFRHFDSATVVQGLIGEQPQTVMVMGYPLFERIHYLLVAGFDVNGSAGHQLATRLYMDFLRMEGEQAFFGLLPRAERQKVRDRWYRDAPKPNIQYLQDAAAIYDGETGVPYRTNDPLAELYSMLKSYVAGVDTKRYALQGSGLAGEALGGLAALSGVRGKALSHLPEMAFLTVRGAPGGDRHFTLFANRAHRNVSVVTGEDRRLLPEEDTLSVLNGIAGAYPNAFFVVEAKALPAFAEAVRGLGSEADYAALLSQYGLRRSDARFWAHSDALHAAYRRSAPKEAGLFDYNRYQSW